jgi:hypothetical protein
VTCSRRAGPWFQWCPALVAFALCLHVGGARAEDPRNTYLIKLLQGSSQFRVRAQAAISLGAVEGSPTAVGALTAALGDSHPAVRAAAANSLGRIGSSTAVAALRRLERDPEEPVRSAATAAIAKLTTPARSMVASARSVPTPELPSGPPRYYVSVAPPGTRVSTIDRKALSNAQSFIKQRVGQIDGVMLAPDGENNQAADRVLKQKNLKGFYLDSSIVSIEKKSNGGTRVAVSVIVATYPGRDMRAIMQGAATVSDSGGDAYIQALEGALSGALRQLPQALAR